MACLDALPWVADCEDVVIERQPPRNATMARLQHYLEMYFVMRDKPVTVQDAKHKLAFAAATPWWPEGMPVNWTYHTRKKLAVLTARKFLDSTPQDPRFARLFASTTKKDDLADSLLQGMAYCHNVRPLELVRRSAAATAVVRPRRPTANQLATGKLSKPNVVHYLCKCTSAEEAAAVVAGNKHLAKAVHTHFGGLDSPLLRASLAY